MPEVSGWGILVNISEPVYDMAAMQVFPMPPSRSHNAPGWNACALARSMSRLGPDVWSRTTRTLMMLSLCGTMSYGVAFDWLSKGQ